MTIQPIVEGPGDEKAIPRLLHRILAEIVGCPHLRVTPPFRLPRQQMVQEERCRTHLRITQATQQVDYVLLFMDSDDDCCKVLKERLCEWGAKEIYRTSFDVICIEREFEAWLLAGIPSLRGIRHIRADATAPENSNRIRGAKERLSSFMPDGFAYSETVDQAALTSSVNLALVLEKSPSFRRLVNKLHSAHEVHCTACVGTSAT